MSDDQNMQSRAILPQEPRVRLRRLQDIVTYEVMASDLDRLEDASVEEKNAVVFCTTALGGAIGGVLGLLPLLSGGVQPILISIYVAITLVLVIVASWFGTVWYRKAKLHKRIANEIRQNAMMPTSNEYTTQGTAKQIILAP